MSPLLERFGHGSRRAGRASLYGSALVQDTRHGFAAGTRLREGPDWPYRLGTRRWTEPLRRGCDVHAGRRCVSNRGQHAYRSTERLVTRFQISTGTRRSGSRPRRTTSRGGRARGDPDLARILRSSLGRLDISQRPDEPMSLHKSQIACSERVVLARNPRTVPGDAVLRRGRWPRSASACMDSELAPGLEPVINVFDPWARGRGEFYSRAGSHAGVRRRIRRSETMPEHDDRQGGE